MNILKFSILTFSVLLSSNALSQSSQKNEDTVKVLCANKVDKRELMYDNIKGAWCDTQIVDFCSSTRRLAIKRACNDVYKYKLTRMQENEQLKSSTAPIEVKDAEKSAELSNLKQEQVEIELKKVEIEQQKLDLRKRELELLKQG